MTEPLGPDAAMALMRKILREGHVAFSQHARDELAKDGMITLDAVNVMRAGAVSRPGEYENGSWRYLVETRRIGVVVSFRSEVELVVVTAWRRRR